MSPGPRTHLWSAIRLFNCLLQVVTFIFFKWADVCVCVRPGPVHLIPSLCCEESCSLSLSQGTSEFQSQLSLNDG